MIKKEYSWMRSYCTTGEQLVMDTYSLNEFKNELSEALTQKVNNKKLIDWNQDDVLFFLSEIGMSIISIFKLNFFFVVMRIDIFWFKKY